MCFYSAILLSEQKACSKGGESQTAWIFATTNRTDRSRGQEECMRLSLAIEGFLLYRAGAGSIATMKELTITVLR